MSEYHSHSTLNTPTFTNTDLLLLGRWVLRTEAEALLNLELRLDDAFLRAVDLILRNTGRVIISGVGKSGNVARKIAATFASTGTPAYFVHPTEASHGDLGMITSTDILLGLSYSGEAEELLSLLPILRRLGTRIIAITGNLDSKLARVADIAIDSSVSREACPHNLVPTASTTATLALGDALAIALLKARGFSRENFAQSHPGGALGRRLLTYVCDVMHPAETVPIVMPYSSLADAVLSISSGGLGMTVICDDSKKVLGIFTDGDLRRAFEKKLNLQDVAIHEVMSIKPKTINSEELAVSALTLMEKFRINQILVTDSNGVLQGALNMHDLFRAKVV